MPAPLNICLRYMFSEVSISRPLKSKCFKQIFGDFFARLHSKLFYIEKVYKFQQIYCKMWKKKMLNEVNQIHNFISSSGSGTVINYGSGSGFLTSYGKIYFTWENKIFTYFCTCSCALGDNSLDRPRTAGRCTSHTSGSDTPVPS